MQKIIKVLLVDDDVDYSKALQGQGRINGIHIVRETNWETAFLNLKEDPGIQFIILDGKCLLDEDQETPKDNFLFKTTKDIEIYSHKSGRTLPYCVNTGYVDRFAAGLEDNVMVFGKAADNTPMFDFVKEEVSKTDLYNYKLKYGPAFNSFSIDLILPTHLSKLIILLDILEGKKQIEKQLFEVARELLEELYCALQAKYNHFQNTATFFHNNSRPNLGYCERYLTGKIVTNPRTNIDYNPNFETPDHICQAISFVSSTSSILSHGGYAHSFEPFVFRSVAFSLLEILSWFPEYVKKNYDS